MAGESGVLRILYVLGLVFSGVGAPTVSQPISERQKRTLDFLSGGVQVLSNRVCFESENSLICPHCIITTKKFTEEFALAVSNI